jgi:hypothetical protein
MDLEISSIIKKGESMAVKRPSWYANSKFIRKRRFHNWSQQEIKDIFLLRSKKTPIDEIINRLGLNVSRIQVYNMIRITRKNRKNLCFKCGNLLTKKERIRQLRHKHKKCTSCNNQDTIYKRKRRIRFVKAGLCTCCGKLPPVKGKKTCKICLSYTHRERIAKGLCGICGKHPISHKSITLCDNCLKHNRENIRRYRTKNANC